MRKLTSQPPLVSSQPKCPDWHLTNDLDARNTEVVHAARIFISYKRHCVPDEAIADELFLALSQRHYVFIDKSILVGTDWAACVEAKLRECDFLITLLSAQSVNSEMVRGEIEKAYDFGKELGRPCILPVRLNYWEPFPYALGCYLNQLQWAEWRSEKNTTRLIEELIIAISGGQLPRNGIPAGTPKSSTSHAEIPRPLPVASLELPEGTMDPQSRFYIEREEDMIALEAIKRRGITMPIKGPRQMGKSSLLKRVVETAKEEGKKTVMLDFQLFDQRALASPDQFFRQFCAWLTLELSLPNKVQEYWDEFLGNPQRATRYIGLYLLKEVGDQLVLAMDEVERIFDTNFRSDFFSMLRYWHVSRIGVDSVWRKLDLVLVTSTEPYQLIDNLNQSPFNVGEVVELRDFNIEAVRELNNRHGSPLRQADVERLMKLVNGHPYLIRRALYLTAKGRLSASDLFTLAAEERGPFDDHLRYHLFRMHDKDELVRGMLEVIRHNTCPDERTFFRLRGAGLVRESGRLVMPRCQLYADYFREHLHA